MCSCFVLVVPSLLVSQVPEGVEFIIADGILNGSKTALHIIRDCMLRKLRLVKPEYFSNIDIAKMLPRLSQVLAPHGSTVVSSQSWGRKVHKQIKFNS